MTVAASQPDSEPSSESGGDGSAGQRHKPADVPDVAAPLDPILTDPNPGLLRWLLHCFYDGVWLLAIVVASPWWIWRCLRSSSFASMVRERLGGVPGATAKRGTRLLIHGVSVGEIKAAAPLVRELTERYPSLEVVISATTNTGLQMAEKLYPELCRVRFPLDFSPFVRRFLRRLQPDGVVLIELEIWPNFLRECNRNAVPVAVVNGRITPESYRSYHLFRSLLPQFNRITLFCVQMEEYAERFRKLGHDSRRVLVAGNLKFDGLVCGERARDEQLVELLGLEAAADCPVVVAGSTHEPEESQVAEGWRERYAHARLILVPRHPERAEEIQRQFACQRLTDLRAGRVQLDPALPTVVDTIGELEAVYSLADVVFVGGSLVPHGGQNMLEPAAQGRPVLFGPHLHNFRQEAELLELRGAGLRVRNPAHLAREVARLLAEPESRAQMAAAGIETVRSQGGVTAETVQALDLHVLRGVLAADSGRP